MNLSQPLLLLTPFPWGEKHLRVEGLTQVMYNVRMYSCTEHCYCVAGGARAPAHAEPELARQEHAHAPPPRCKANAPRQARVGIVRSVLQIFT